MNRVETAPVSNYGRLRRQVPAVLFSISALVLASETHANNFWHVERVAGESGNNYSINGMGRRSVPNPLSTFSRATLLSGVQDSARKDPWCTSQEGVTIDGTHVLCIDEKTIKLSTKNPLVVTGSIRMEPWSTQANGGIDLHESMRLNPAACLHAKEELSTEFQASVTLQLGKDVASQLVLEAVVDPSQPPIAGCGEESL